MFTIPINSISTLDYAFMDKTENDTIATTPTQDSFRGEIRNLGLVPWIQEDYLTLEKEADAAALQPFCGYQNTREIARKYQRAAELAILRGDREKTASLLKKATEILMDGIEWHNWEGFKNLQRSIVKLQELGEEKLAENLQFYLLDIFNHKIAYWKDQNRGTQELISYSIEKADLLEKMGMDPHVVQLLYKEAADILLTHPDIEHSLRWCYIPLLYEKAKIDSELSKELYKKAYKEFASTPNFDEIENWITKILTFLENQTEESSEKLSYPLDDPRAYWHLHYFLFSDAILHQPLEFLAFKAQGLGEAVQLMETEFDHLYRSLKLLLPRDNGPIPTSKWPMKYIENDISHHIFARFFALGEFLSLSLQRQNSDRAREIQDTLATIKPLLSRYNDEFQEECERIFSLELQRLEALFNNTKLQEMGAAEILDLMSPDDFNAKPAF